MAFPAISTAEDAYKVFILGNSANAESTKSIEIFTSGPVQYLYMDQHSQDIKFITKADLEELPEPVTLHGVAALMKALQEAPGINLSYNQAVDKVGEIVGQDTVPSLTEYQSLVTASGTVMEGRLTKHDNSDLSLVCFAIKTWIDNVLYSGSTCY